MAELSAMYYCHLLVISLYLLIILQGKLLHCEPPPGVDSVDFSSHVVRVKKEKTHSHSENHSSSVSVFCNSFNR